MPDNETCPRDGRPIDEHTVGEFKQCMSDLHDHDLPFEHLGQPVDQDLAVVLAGAISVKAGTHRSEVGKYPVLVFEFTTTDGPLQPIALVLDTTAMRAVRTLVGSAVEAAVLAARR